mgnify:CR=1 FL=1
MALEQDFCLGLLMLAEEVKVNREVIAASFLIKNDIIGKRLKGKLL